MENDGNIFQCAICFFRSVSHNRLMSHYIRHHKQDLYFRITCIESGCAATFKKWKFFRQHLFRKHPAVPPILDEIALQIESENQLNQDSIIAHNESVSQNQLNQEAVMVHDESIEDKGIHLTLEVAAERLQLHAAQFLLNAREQCNMSHTAIEHITDGVINLLDIYSAIDNSL